MSCCTRTVDPECSRAKMTSKVQATRQLLQKNEAQIVEDWVATQRAAPTMRSDLVQEPELREHSSRFVALFRSALELEEGSDAAARGFTPVREFLSELSAKRGRQGFTASETATFVFSFKQPLFNGLQQALANDPKALAQEMWEMSMLLDKLGLFTTEVHQKTREEVIRRQQQELVELSTPVIKIWDGVLALPLIGTLDSNRTQLVMEALLQRIVDTGSLVAIIDITGVPTVDTLTAQHLIKTVTATRLLGAECIISGISPAIAQMLVQLGVNLGDVPTKATLAAALGVALKRTGRSVVKDARA
jgi:rsbT co-antagonist protein RsbR